ncbi:hypothetical protein AVEN_172285-1 [Araneus ventricosus]|uniref:Uncharacterized protein n=1 Tax=Araneus ventricosus TaxID=182803 RepID=A0A4Y2S3L2_ARAVE|nr:hypothetical protein AVEN_172285-1 [Araneus ventricosus]
MLNRSLMACTAPDLHFLSMLQHHSSEREFGHDGFNLHLARMHGGSSVESGIEPEALWHRERGLITRPPRTHKKFGKRSSRTSNF